MICLLLFIFLNTVKINKNKCFLVEIQRVKIPSNEEFFLVMLKSYILDNILVLKINSKRNFQRITFQAARHFEMIVLLDKNTLVGNKNVRSKVWMPLHFCIWLSKVFPWLFNSPTWTKFHDLMSWNSFKVYNKNCNCIFNCNCTVTSMKKHPCVQHFESF